MKQTSGPARKPAEAVIKDIRRATRRQFSAEEKIRIVLEGLRGEDSIRLPRSWRSSGASNRHTCRCAARALEKLGIARATFYRPLVRPLPDRRARGAGRPTVRLDLAVSGTACPRRSASSRSSRSRWRSRSCRRANWRCASPTRSGGTSSQRRQRSTYRLLKAQDRITSPAYLVIKAADEFKDKTTAPNQLWQADFTYLKVTGWGWDYLSTVRDDFFRFIVAWKLGATMRAEDVTATLDRTLAAAGLELAPLAWTLA
jgi:putative transposase